MNPKSQWWQEGGSCDSPSRPSWSTRRVLQRGQMKNGIYSAYPPAPGQTRRQRGRDSGDRELRVGATRERCQVSLGVEGAHTPRSRRGDRLAVDVVLDVTDRE